MARVRPNLIFAGVIDDIRIYNRALAPEEVRQIYEARGTDLHKPPACASPQKTPQPDNP